MPMQPLVDYGRDTLTSAQVTQLLRDDPAITVSAGAQLVDIGLNVLEDIGDDLLGGDVERQSYSTLHGSCRLQLGRELEWGSALIRPYITIENGTMAARFYLGVYHTSTPARSLGDDRPVYDVEGYDILLRLNQTPGSSYSIAAGDSYLGKVEEIISSQGYTQYVIDQQAAATVTTTPRVWAFDDQITWLTIINDLLGAVGYAGIWSDWLGRPHCEPYQTPLARSPEWYYTTDMAEIEMVMLGGQRSVEKDYFATPNRWVFINSTLAEGVAPVEGAGIYTYENESIGETSHEARGFWITRREEVDVAGQGELIARAQMTIDADMQVPTVINVVSSPNPLHWHFDRLLVNDPDAGPVADVMCTQWRLTLPPGAPDHQQTWRVLYQ